MVMRLSAEDHAKVDAAVAAAEANTDGEIVTIVAPVSDRYNDVVLHWALLVIFLALAVLAMWPALLVAMLDSITGGWGQAPALRHLLTLLLAILTAVFLLARLVFGLAPVRIALTPGATRSRRVRRRALELFRVAAEQRTRAATAVLLYISLAEHRAELIADATIDAKVTPDVWGETMAAMVAAVHDGRTGDGIADAVTRIGVILHTHFPRSSDDTNELPDRLIEL